MCVDGEGEEDLDGCVRIGSPIELVDFMILLLCFLARVLFLVLVPPGSRSSAAASYTDSASNAPPDGLRRRRSTAAGVPRSVSRAAQITAALHFQRLCHPTRNGHNPLPSLSSSLPPPPPPPPSASTRLASYHPAPRVRRARIVSIVVVWGDAECVFQS